MQPHILIVDDEAGPREALEFALQRENKWWRISTAGSVDEAKKIIASPPAAVGPVDVLLTDLVMGADETAGMGLLDYARRQDPFLLSILFTAKSKSLNRFEAFEIGAFDCIEKTILGRSASREILVKTRAAIAFRKMALAHLESLEANQRVEEALRESEERYALASRAANDGLWDWNLETGRAFYSPRWKSLIGFEEDEIGDQPEEWLGRIHPEDRPAVRQQIDDHLEGRAARLDCEFRMLCKDGSHRWMRSRGLAMRGEDERPRRMVGSQTDVTAQKELEDQLRAQVFSDALTGIGNRALLLERLDHAIKRSRRQDGVTFALVTITFDRFERVNESFGGEAGDRALVEIANRLREHVRTGDTVARLAGAEFAVLLEACRSNEQGASLTERLQESLAAAFEIDGNEIYLTSRVGLALGGFGSAGDALLRSSQTAANRARTLDRAYCFYEEAMRVAATDHILLESELRRAIQDRQLLLHYQPILRLASKRVVGFEALARWERPQHGLVMPDEFIPSAEESGLIHKLGAWVLSVACRQLKQWQDSHPRARRLTVSVNVSGQQWLQPDFADLVAETLIETQLTPQSLKLEITESMLMNDQPAAAETMTRLRDLGVEIYVDDFGTGYSAIGSLHAFPVSALKIDRTFVDGMLARDDGRELVSTVVELARKHDLTTIAEGIESREQLERLRELGCEFGQGFLFARPMAPEEILTRLLDRLPT